jgi:hypothetical protein
MNRQCVVWRELEYVIFVCVIFAVCMFGRYGFLPLLPAALVRRRCPPLLSAALVRRCCPPLLSAALVRRCCPPLLSAAARYTRDDGTSAYLLADVLFPVVVRPISTYSQRSAHPRERTLMLCENVYYCGCHLYNNTTHRLLRPMTQRPVLLQNLRLAMVTAPAMAQVR